MVPVDCYRPKRTFLACPSREGGGARACRWTAGDWLGIPDWHCEAVVAAWGAPCLRLCR